MFAAVPFNSKECWMCSFRFKVRFGRDRNPSTADSEGNNDKQVRGVIVERMIEPVVKGWMEKWWIIDSREIGCQRRDVP
jgi:hypothetical protein